MLDFGSGRCRQLIALGKLLLPHLTANKSDSENPVVRVYIAVNDILQRKSQHLIRVLAFMTMGLFLQGDKVFLVQVHSSDSSQ
jgi:hypothetical protein